MELNTGYIQPKKIDQICQIEYKYNRYCIIVNYESIRHQFLSKIVKKLTRWIIEDNEFFLRSIQRRSKSQDPLQWIKSCHILDIITCHTSNNFNINSLNPHFDKLKTHLSQNKPLIIDLNNLHACQDVEDTTSTLTLSQNSFAKRHSNSKSKSKSKSISKSKSRNSGNGGPGIANLGGGNNVNNGNVNHLRILNTFAMHNINDIIFEFPSIMLNNEMIGNLKSLHLSNYQSNFWQFKSINYLKHERNNWLKRQLINDGCFANLEYLSLYNIYFLKDNKQISIIDSAFFPKLKIFTLINCQWQGVLILPNTLLSLRIHNIQGRLQFNQCNNLREIQTSIFNKLILNALSKYCKKLQRFVIFKNKLENVAGLTSDIAYPFATPWNNHYNIKGLS